MQFGLKNASGAFQRAMDAILVSVLWHFVVIYLDSIVVFLKWLEDDTEHVRRILQLLYEAEVSLELKKCKFVTETILY